MAMNKQNLSKMQDTKWHIGYVTKDPDDPRRDKRRCVYYTEGTCQGVVRCPGSSHCRDYKEGKPRGYTVKPSEEYKVPSFQEIRLGSKMLCRKTGMYGTVMSKGIMIKNGYNNHYVEIEYSTGERKKYDYPREFDRNSIVQVLNFR